MRNICGLLTVILFLSHNTPATGQDIRINEITPSNSTIIADEDGDFSDWIEIYNSGSGIIQLEGWGLSDNSNNPFKWVFPEVSLSSGQYLLVWASGKNRKPSKGEYVNGVMREEFSNITGTGIQVLTQHSSYPDKPSSHRLIRDYFEAPVDVADNYGQKMYGYVKAPAMGSYTFRIASDDNGQLWLSSDDTPGNLRLIAEVPGWTGPGEWDKFPQQKSAPVILEKERYYYIMALAKEGSGGDNLAVGWQHPDGTSDMPISGRYLFWPEGELHTSYNISANGEDIILTNPQGIQVDEIPAVDIPSDISYGLIPDGSQNLRFMTEPTPGKPNQSANYSGILSPPQFSHTGGFYGGSFQLSLSSSQPGVSVVYTLDGSLPDAGNCSGTRYQYKNQYPQNPGSLAGPFLYRSFQSYLYSAPVEIRDRTSDGNQVSMISSTYNYTPNYLPSYPVDKAMVVKARAVKEDALSSEVVSHTYFIRNGGLDPYTLPVVSISAREDLLFDYYKGLYVAGVDFENWRTANPSAGVDGGKPANYNRDGDEWEYPAHMELFDISGNRALAQNIGFRLHGAWSRAHPYKSLRIYARSIYGASELKYAFFKDLDYGSYKRIILRNSGNDIQYTMFRDAALQQMFRHMNFETMAYQPSILFLNGEYWGLHNIRERYDKHYLARRFGVNEEQLDILEDNMAVVEGDDRHYAETLEYMTQYGLQSSENYEYIKTRMDVTSFIDYMVAEIFMVNTDWPGNNIKYWRLRTTDYLSGAGPGKDGRWRWLMFDTDFGFGLYNSSDFTKNMMTFTTAANGPDWPNPPWSTFLFRKLLENESFRTSFIVRFCDQLNTAMKPEVLKSVIDYMQPVIEPEMARHIQRWKIPGSMASWKSNVNNMKNFANYRPYHASNHLRQFFGIAGEYTLTVDVSQPDHGHVVVNTIPLTRETRGVPEIPYPWQGKYFIKIPLRLEAVADSGYEFVRWQSGTTFFDQPILEINPAGDQNFIAIFGKSGQTDDVARLPQSKYPGSGDSELPVFPNPFSHSATLYLYPDKAEMAVIGLFDMSGRQISEIHRGVQPAGINSYRIDGNKLRPGVYIIVCRTGSGIYKQKLVKY